MKESCFEAEDTLLFRKVCGILFYRREALTDGSYYRLTISVGENGSVSTVYNVGKIKKDSLPNGKIKTIYKGSKANSESTDIIPDSEQKINTSDENSSKNFRIAFAELDNSYMSAVERGDMVTSESITVKAL